MLQTDAASKRRNACCTAAEYGLLQVLCQRGLLSEHWSICSSARPWLSPVMQDKDEPLLAARPQDVAAMQQTGADQLSKVLVCAAGIL